MALQSLELILRSTVIPALFVILNNTSPTPPIRDEMGLIEILRGTFVSYLNVPVAESRR